MHLVSWDILKRPISEGGLQIRDPGLENMALGDKIIWQLYVDKNHLVSKIIWMKYLKGGSLRNLKTANNPTCTTIQNLCRRGIDNIQQQLYKIPDNGKQILMWDDNILGILPLSSIISLKEIKLWLTNKGLLWVANICSWDSAGNWVGWSFSESPDHLLSQQ